jgi:hypothetical protein
MKGASTIRFTLLTLSLAIALSSCAWGTLTPDEFEARQVHAVCGAAFQPGGMNPTFRALRDAAGTPLRATEIVVYAEYAMFELRDRAHPDHLNDWTVRGTSVEPPSPVAVSKVEDLEARTFDLIDYPWSDLPRALNEGLDALSLESGTVIYLIVKRSEPGDPVRTRAYFGGPRQSGWVEYDQTLGILSVQRN